MREKTRFLLMVLVFFVFITGLVSCKNPNETGGNFPDTVDEEVIYSPYVDTALVLGEGIEIDDVKAIRNVYFAIVGKEISIKVADEEPSEHEIIIGKTDREISNKAYRTLLLNNNDEEKVGFSIYSDGKSVAIAYDKASFGENIALSEAMDCFVSKYMKNDSLKLSSGVAYIDTFYPIEKQKERDETAIDRLWQLKYSQISSKLENIHEKEEITSNIIKELKSLFGIYNSDYSTIEWLANLYDPVTGGFYYSNSARNNVGFAPNLGSTAEALYLTELILGGYGGTLTDYFGEEIAGKFVSFAKNMQDPNGYFYHPQWNRDLIDKTPERKEIDVTYALSILEAFDASPVYDTPNGVKGEVIKSISKLTLPICIDKTTAVAKLVSAEKDEIYIPSYLKSEESFKDYLSSLDIKNDVVGVCKTLSSELPLYIVVDEKLAASGESYRLCDLLKNYLDRNKHYSGLWISSKNPSYKDIGNVADVIKIYNGIGAAIPNYKATLEVIVDALEFNTDPENISDIALLWTALGYTVNNIRYYSNELYQGQIKDDIISIYIKIDKLIRLTMDKLFLFIRDDGSFSSTPNGSESTSYGIDVAVPLSKEGDINATLIAIKNIWRSIFSVLDIGDVPIFNTSDRMMFQKILLDMGVIVKNEIIKSEPESYENYEINSTADLKTVLTSSNSYQKIVADSEEHGNVLYLYSSADARTDEFYLKPQTTVKSATCYSYEADFRVLPEQSAGVFAYIYLYRNMSLISLERIGNEIRLVERTDAWGDTGYYTDLGVRAQVGEWFNIRVEYYLGTRETVRIKIFFNGNCVAVTDNFVTKQSATGLPSSTFEGMVVMSMQNKDMRLQIDNYVCESSYKIYTPETSKDLILNIDTPDKKQVIHGFDGLNEGTTPGNFKPDDSSAVKVKLDSDGNNVLAITEKAGEIILPIDQRGTAPNSAVVEFDIIVDSDSATGAKYQINFNEYLYKERTLGAVQLTVVEEGGQKYVAISDVTDSGKLGTTYSNTKLSLGVKYNLRLQLFCKEKAMIISVDGVIIGINANILANAEKYNLYETTINSLTPSNTSTILIDNLVSEKTADDYVRATTPEEPRVEYTFDNTDGMDISGIEPTNGVLSFNDLQSGEANIIFPLTKRAIKPTLSVFKFDVIKNEKTYGEVIVKLTDKAGNIAAALAIVRSGNGISVHEYTENGAYPTPLYTTEAESFAVTVKYSEEIKGYNLYIDGKYITSSSITYTYTSGEYKFEALHITARVSAGIGIDNLYAEKVNDYLVSGFNTHTVESTERDPITFEEHSFASMPKPFYAETANSADSSVTVREDKTTGGAISKVVEFYAAAGNDTIYMERIQKNPPENNAAFFETDMKIVSLGGEASVMVSLKAYVNNQYPWVSDITLTADAPGAPIKLSGKGFEKEIGVTEGTWFKLRYEYADAPYDYDYDGKPDCVIRVYVNDVLVGSGHNVNDSNLLPEYTGIFQSRIVAQTPGYIYVDNIILGQCNIEYDAPPPADTHTLTYSAGVVATYQTVFTFGKTTSTGKIIDMANASDAANKVLEFYTSAASADKLAVMVTKTAEPDENANAVMFETDIMINPESDAATFYLEPQTAKNQYPFRLTLKATKGGNVTISALDIPETVIGVCGEWIHLKVEYMNPRLDYTSDNVFDILYKIYLGNSEIPLAIGYKPQSSSSYYNPLDLTKFVFTTASDSVSKVFLDNTRFWQVERTPDEAESSGSSNNGSISGNYDKEVDENGWS